MRILDEKEAKEALRWIDAAAEVARRSPCLRAKCGSVIVRDGKIIGAGFNSPPRENQAHRTCLAEYDIPAGFRHDRTCCIHAEQRAILDTLRRGEELDGATIYYVSVDASGGKEFAIGSKCTICSRMALDMGISAYVLWCADGIRSYETAEFNRLAYEFKTPKR